MLECSLGGYTSIDLANRGAVSSSSGIASGCTVGSCVVSSSPVTGTVVSRFGMLRRTMAPRSETDPAYMARKKRYRGASSPSDSVDEGKKSVPMVERNMGLRPKRELTTPVAKPVRAG